MVIDRIEGDLAAVEVTPDEFMEIPVADILGKVRDGATIHLNSEGIYQVDEEETKTRKERARARTRSLFS